MKKNYLVILIMVAFAMIWPPGVQSVEAQSYTYKLSKSNLNAGNPGGVNTSYDYVTTGSIIHRYNAGPGGSTGAYNPANYWSPARALPFTFKFYGATVDSFCVSKNGLVTFNTSVAGTLVNSNLNTNRSMPYANVPDSTIAYFWENNATFSRGSNDNVYGGVRGTSPNRQYWIHNYSFRHGSMSFCYFALVLEEGTNKIYVVDMNYKSGNGTMTVGTQLSSTSAVQFTTGLHSSAGSPNIIMGTGSTPNTDNEYYIFTPKQLVQDDMAVVSLDNPGSTICNAKDTIKVTVKNEGTNTVTSFDVKWKVNGVAQTTYSWSGSLAKDASTQINLGLLTYPSGANVDFEIATSAPNGNSDNNNTNDTLKLNKAKGMSGTVTVAASGADYTTVQKAVDALEKVGVCGPVIVKVAAGTYTGKVNIGPIAGTSSTNTVTFQGAGQTSTIISAKTNTSSEDRATIILDDASNLIFRDMTITNTGTSYGWAVHFTGNTSNCTFRKCLMTVSTSSTSSNMMPVVFSNSKTSQYTSGQQTDDNTIDSCTIEGGYCGIWMYGNSANKPNGNVLTNNRFTKNYYYAMYGYYINNIIVNYNHITLRTGNTNSYGMYWYYLAGNSSTGSTVGSQINYNIIDSYGRYGIYCYYGQNPSTDQGLIMNNMISGHTNNYTSAYYGSVPAGIFLRYGGNWRVYNNTVNMDGPAGNAHAMTSYAVSNYDYRNNIFSTQASAGASSYAFYSNYTPSTTRMVDYNAYYNGGRTNLIYSGGARTASVLNTYNTNGDANSVMIKPPLISSTNLHLSDACFERGTSIAVVTDDIDGESRASTPHIGADEIAIKGLDAGVVEILSPNGVVSSGSQTVEVAIKNFGTTSLVSVEMKFKVGSSSTVSETVNFIPTLGNCAIDTQTFSTTFTHSSGCDQISAWTESPNTSTDQNSLNDGVGPVTFGIPMAGTYTVGGTSPDFVDMDAALTGLKCAGISGAVVFNVRSGTYNVNWRLKSDDIPGISSTNSIKFQSDASNSTMPVLQHSATGASDNYVVQFAGITHITFDGLDVRANGTAYAHVFDFVGTNKNVTISNCMIVGQEVTTSSWNYVLIFDNSGVTDKSDSNTITGNTLVNGASSIYIQGYTSSTSYLQSGWVITNNTIKDFYYSGIFLRNMTGTRIDDNAISSNTNYTYAYGMYMYYCDGAMSVQRNSITGLKGRYGMYMYYCDATSGSPSYIANNFIHIGGEAFNSAYGMYIRYCKHQKVYYNTIVNTSTYNSASYPAVYLYLNSSTYAGNEFKNNSITAANYALYMYSTTYSYVDSDYNNIYSSRSGNFIYAGSYYSSVSAYSTARSLDGNSFQTNPLFAQAGKPTMLSTVLDSAATNLTSITDDIHGKTRRSSSSIGCQEYTVYSDDCGITSIDLPTVACASNNAVVTITNFGSSNLTSATISWTVDGVTQSATGFVGSLALGQSAQVNLGSFTTSGSGPFKIEAWTILPNAKVDPQPENDSASSTISLGMTGTFTVGGSGADYPTVQAAADAVIQQGVCGPVIFKVAPGTYTEQVKLAPIVGSSEINTVTFEPASGTVKVQWASTSWISNYVVLTNGADNVIFKNLTLEANAIFSTYSRVIDFSGGSSNIIVTGCNLVGRTDVFTSSTYASILYKNSSISDFADKIKIENCNITGGAHALYFNGYYNNPDTRLMFVNNTVSKFYYMGMYTYYQDSLTVTGNKMTNPVPGSFTQYGLYLNYSDNTRSISNNDISIDGNNTYGVYARYCQNASGDSSIWVNNFISIDNSTATSGQRGVYFYQCSNLFFAHNNISINGGLTFSNGGTCLDAYASSSLYSGWHFYNNNFRSSKTNTLAAWYRFASSVTWFAQNNNYDATYVAYSTSGFIYTTVATLQSGTGKNVGATWMDPMYESATDLHIHNIKLMKAGKGVGIMTDFDADTRDATTPTTGAHEIDPDIEVVSITPVTLSCGPKTTTHFVQVTLKNLGDIDLVDVPLELTVNGGTPITATMTTTLGVGGTATFSFPSSIDISGMQDYNLVVKAKNVYDVNTANDSATLYIPYWPEPVPAFTFSEVCLGAATMFDGSSTFTGTTSSVVTVTYAWDFGDGNTASGEDVSHTYAANGTYKVLLTVTSNNGCKDTISHMVTIQDMTPGTISASQVICSGTTPNGLVSVTGAGGSTGAYTYQWQSSTNSGTSWSDISGATSADYAPGNISTETMFRREAESVSGCGPVYSNEVTISLFSPGVAGSIVADQTICFNTAPNTFVEGTPASGGDGNYTYQWQVSSDNVTFSNISGATAFDYTSGALTSTTYFRRVDNSCNDDNTNTLTVTVHPKLVAGAITGDQTVCPGGTPTLFTETSAAAGGDGTYTYQWQSSPNKVTWTDISGANAATYQAGGISANTWFRRTDISGSSCGEESTQAILVEVAPLPVPDFVLATHCFGDPMPVTNNSNISSGSIVSYEWDMGDGTSSTAKVPAHTYTTAGTYTVKLIVTSNFGCKDSITKQIKISSIPTPTFKNFYDCATDSMRFKNTTITTCGSITGYYWDFGDGSTSNVVNPSHKYAAPGTYQVELRITVPGGFTDSTTQSVTILAPGKADFTTKDVCFGESVQFVNNSLNAVSLSWDFGDNTSSNISGPQHFYRVIGTYTVKLHVTDGNGCVNTMTKQVEVKVKPYCDFTTDNRCDGSAVPFVNGTLYADSYLWHFGDGTTDTVKNPNHTYPAAATYNIILYADNLNGCKDTMYSGVTVYPNPSAGFTSAGQCDGESVAFTNTSTGGSTYDWTFGDATTSTDMSPGHVYPDTGSYNVTLTAESIHGCTDVATGTVTINSTPEVDFSATTACDGDTTKFTNNSTIGDGTMAHSWDFGDGNGSTMASPMHVYASAGKYTVTLTVTGSAGNCTESMTKTVVVNESPTAGFTAANVCDGNAVGFTNTSTGATAYMWDFGDGNSATSAAPSHTYASSGVYTAMLTVSNAHNCKSSTTQSITVYDKPTAAFTSTTECLGTATTFTNGSTIATGTMTYNWDFGNGRTSTSTDPTHTYAQAGKYLVTLTATSANGCEAKTVQNVTVYDVPVPSFTTGNVCLGDPTPFTNHTVGAVSYSWDFGDASFSTAMTPSHTYAVSGTFPVTLTASNSDGCSASYIQNAVVWDNPTVGFTNVDACVNTIMTFSNSSATGTYMWDFGDGYVSSSANPTHIYKRSGNFDVTLEVVNNFGCENKVTKQVTVYAEPKPAFTASDVCAGTNAVFTNLTAGATSYLWKFGDGRTSTATNPTHSYTSGGTYVVTLEATNSNGCVGSVMNSIRVNALPTASFTSNNTCLGQTTTFRNTSSGGSYVWDFGDGSGSTRPDPTHTYGAAGTFTVKLTVTNEKGCVSTVSKTVTVSPIPTVDFSATANCSGPTAVFTNNSSVASGSLTYSWDFGDGSTDNSASPSKTYAQGGNYFVTLNAVTNSGCASSANKVVTVYDLAVARFTAESVCEGENVVFYNSSQNMTSASWEFGDGNSSNSIAPTHKYASVGSFSVKLTVKNPIGCESSVVNTVQVNANPVASFSTADACERTDIAFTNSSTGASAYDWSFGDGQTSGAQEPTHQYTQSGTKRVTLTAISAAGCTDEATGTITIYRRPIAQFEVSNTCYNDVTRFKNTSLNGSSYSWDFGDGNNSTIAHPTQTYASTGTYSVVLTVSNSNCDDKMTQDVVIKSLPVSTFTHTVDGRDVDFTPTTTTGISEFLWNFGDGTTGSGSTISHNYANAVVKTFNACLKTTGTNGCVSESCDDVKIDILGVSTSALDQFVIYPNPNKGLFQIQLGDIQGDLEIEITDLVGKTIKVVDTSVTTNNYDVDLGQIADGVYMVVVRNGNSIATKKIVVNN